MHKIINTITTTIFVLIIVVLAGYFLLRSKGILEIYKVQTGSMEDNIHIGDYILIQRKNSYKVGDIITYKKDNYYITHRIVKQDGDKIITKGDANNTTDDAISINDVIGKVLYSGNYLNYLIDYKYVIISILLGFYLISYCLDKNTKKST